MSSQIPVIDREKFEHKVQMDYQLDSGKGLSEETVRYISKEKEEPEWMLDFRLKCLRIYQSMNLPKWEGSPSLDGLDLKNIIYYAKPGANKSTNWDDVPEEIKKTFDKLGIPESEQKALGGTGAQLEGEVVYHKLKKEWEEKGVIFEDCDWAIKNKPELIKKYFMKAVPPTLHKFAALHGAVWSGGTFLYVPKGVKITLPLQAYFRMNKENMGQFEHTLIIVDEGAEVSYVEGCSAPQYTSSSLHAGCVEIFVKKKARARYNSIENWSRNTYNLNTKRAIVEEDGLIEWVNGNMGSKVTMLYPCSVLTGKRAKSDFLGIAFAGSEQNQDTGTKVHHLAPDTSSTIRSKSISKDGGITTYRGIVTASKNATNCKINVQCDALMADGISESHTIPYMDVNTNKSSVEHEATVSKIEDEQIFYLMSRGLSRERAQQMIISGFIEPIVKALPMEYAIELNRLIEIEMEDSLG
jgi:Fe-S cluster assembly protein SufB